MPFDTQERWIELTAADGHRLDAFEVRPASPRGAVVVLQEIFGVNAHIQDVTRRVAAAGYTAIAPALFDRARKQVSLPYDKGGIDQGIALKNQVAPEQALQDTAASMAAVAAGGGAVAAGGAGVAVIGFCWGGSLAWLAAHSLPVASAVAYYGGQIGSTLDQAPAAPLMAHFGTEDASIPPEVSAAVKQRYGAVVTRLYPAGHGFNCNERGSYHADSAALAWRRTLAFLGATLE